MKIVLRPVRTWILAGLVALLPVTALAACGGDDDSDGATSDEGGNDSGGTAPPLPIDQVQTYDVESNFHVETFVDYAQTPPVGGDHAPAWQNCQFFDKPIYKEAGVHSLEHGGVWITYKPDLAPEEVAQIQTLVDSQTEMLASPWDEAEDGTLPAPIVLSAWGAQVGVETMSSPAVADFIATYREGPNAPEAGVPCSQGITTTK